MNKRLLQRLAAGASNGRFWVSVDIEERREHFSVLSLEYQRHV